MNKKVEEVKVDCPKRLKVLKLWAGWLGRELDNQMVDIYKSFSYKELVRPFIIQDRSMNPERNSYMKLSIKYNVTYEEVRTILRKDY